MPIDELPDTAIATFRHTTFISGEGQKVDVAAVLRLYSASIEDGSQLYGPENWMLRGPLLESSSAASAGVFTLMAHFGDELVGAVTVRPMEVDVEGKRLLVYEVPAPLLTHLAPPTVTVRILSCRS